MNTVFPFSAIVGQDDMKLSLQIAAIDASIGGVLVLGDRGTGKTTAMRALAALLPPISVVEHCRFACDPAQQDSYCEECQKRAQTEALTTAVRNTPVVDLPLGASEDRVVGALDLEKALTVGVKAFEPGLLAAANRGFLYIDEVNLLEDHLVDLLLDVAVSGVNVVERDGLSIRHAAKFLLVGSGNPEEGELRPQLLDRFGLSIDVVTPQDIEQRMQIVRLRDRFEQNPESFVQSFAQEDAAVREQILQAKSTIHAVHVSDDSLRTISELCIALGTDGLRGELTLMRACRAYAALSGDKHVEAQHIQRVASMSLRHRLRRDPLDDSGSGTRVERAMNDVGLAVA